MIYNNFYNLKLSSLGMGAMRLPTSGDGWSAPIDEAAVDQMVAYAIEQGVNYFDTAWGYHGGQSEVVMGKALLKYPRDSWYLADKFPGYDLSNMGKQEEIFAEQLKRCGVAYFDFYLFHNVCEMNIDAYLDRRIGVFDFLVNQKAAGRIRHLGFSAHGSVDVMKRFLEAYGEKLDFCQIQLNYLDWSFQDAKGKMELLSEYKIPVWAMEPMRGGQLARLSHDDAAKLTALRPSETAAAWAFRFIQSLPEVMVTLTGASDFEQLKENIGTYKEGKRLHEREFAALSEIATGMIAKSTVPCTACRYCAEHCPQGLDIAHLLSLYNEHTLTGGGFIAPMALMALPADKHPKDCIGCKNCEAVCPQQIKIADALSDFAAMLGR